MLTGVPQARELAQELLAQAKDMTADTENSPTPPSSSDGGKAPSRTGFKVPPDVRKNKVAQVMGLLEREYVSRFLNALYRSLSLSCSTSSLKLF